MITWLTKNVAEYRLETIDEVKQFEQDVRDKAAKENYTIAAFAYTRKEVKAKGEIIDEFFVIKVTSVFNDAKNPEKPFKDVEFTKMSLAEVDADEGEDSPWD